MTKQEYTDRVLAALRHVTEKEEALIRAELDAHIEDHICALLDLGYDPELAEQRTMAAMGDPEEVGKELNKQYPLRWLIVGGLAKAAAVWLALMLILFSIADDGTGLLLSWQLRLRPRTRDIDQETAELLRVEGSELLDIRLPIGNDVVRLKQITVEWDSSIPGWVARVYAACYDRSPIGIASGPDMTLENQRGEQSGAIAIARGPWYHYYDVRVPVELEDDYVTVSFCQFGETASCQVPLPKEISS